MLELSREFVFVGSCLATKVFIGNLPPGVGHHKVGEGQLPTNQLHDINWGARDHASRAPQ